MGTFYTSKILAIGLLTIATFAESEAATVNITGSRFGHDGVGAFVGYGSSTSRNNVVGYGASRVTDSTSGTAWHVESSHTDGAVMSNVANYAVDWYFVGAESGDHIRFLTLGFTENDQNNRLGGATHNALAPIGTTIGSGVGSKIALSLLDLDTGTALSNSDNNKPGNFIASLMYAYVKPTFKKGVLTGWQLSRRPTDWFIFGFDDAGSADNDHDDFMAIGHLREITAPVTATPLPGAFPLLATAFGGAFVASRWRQRKTMRAGI